MASQPLPTSMRAWQFNPSFFSSSDLTSPSSLKLNQTAPVPQLKANQTLIKVASASVNPIDYKLGEVPFVGRMAAGSPAIPSMDFAGHVWKTTLPDPGFKAGDLVFGKSAIVGALADFVIVTGREGVVPSPPNVDPDWLATLGVTGITAYQAVVPYLENNGPGSGQGKSVFINGGSGGVGTYAIQIAKALGAAKVVVTCSGANAELVKGIGADHVVDYRSVQVLDGLKKWIQEDNNGEKFDVVVDAVGHDLGLYYAAHEYAKESTTYLSLGGGISVSAFWGLTKAMMLPSFLGGGQRKFTFLGAQEKRDQYARLAQWMAEGKVKTVVDTTYGMDEVREAYKKLKTGRTRGNIVIRVSEDGRS